ncbi:putative G-patch domain containing protein [Leishmania utingensis]|uniref:PinX1-related protein 1 n=1 Tax=Leishmania utingensis TaxID=653362 RepID=A0AAW3B0U3_9TRYP
MSTDPNGNRWSNAEKNFGKALLKRSGWTEGTGLGKGQDGAVSHVKVSRKDDVMGLGYHAGVQDTWTTQSLGFADVLTRIKVSTTVAISDSDDDGEVSPSSLPTTSGEAKKIGMSRHYTMYAKRNALKMELIHGGDSAEMEAKRFEILGSAATKCRRDADNNDVTGAPDQKRSRCTSSASTLKSPLLLRLMVRCTTDEPKPTADDMTPEERILITKPHPRPPKCTDTPFLA